MRSFSVLALGLLLASTGCSSGDDASTSQASSGAGGSAAAGASGAGGPGGAGGEGQGGDAQAGSSQAGGAQAGGAQAGEGQGGSTAGGQGGSAQAGSGGSGGEGFKPPAGGGFDPEPFGGGRPVKLFVPGGYAKGKPAPLVLLLHGFTASGAVQDGYLGFQQAAAEKGFLYAYPDGTLNAQGQRFWNATNACCDFGKQGIDDVGYLSALIDEIKGRYDVDARRVYLAGHSNGGFMSYRMACERADMIAGVVSLAGATWADPSLCKPSQPVAVMQVHSTLDETVLYGGGLFFGAAYPSAVTTVETWAKLDGCSLEADASAPPVDLDAGLPGAETSVRRYAKGCKPGGHAELWTIQNGTHIPSVNGTFARAALDFCLAHPKP